MSLYKPLAVNLPLSLLSLARYHSPLGFFFPALQNTKTQHGGLSGPLICVAGCVCYWDFERAKGFARMPRQHVTFWSSRREHLLAKCSKVQVRLYSQPSCGHSCTYTWLGPIIVGREAAIAWWLVIGMVGPLFWIRGWTHGSWVLTQVSFKISAHPTASKLRIDNSTSSAWKCETSLQWLFLKFFSIPTWSHCNFWADPTLRRQVISNSVASYKDPNSALDLVTTETYALWKYHCTKSCRECSFRRWGRRVLVIHWIFWELCEPCCGALPRRASWG